ncbi:MAG: AraC family transcriptional regulator [Cyclobacteriaceae bacterium]|jgi:AraC-like DNA-binding protein|nr:AraC family transcriptional regulator [Cyclobacteriaceae bacterium]
MKHAPFVSVDEFLSYTQSREEVDQFVSEERHHPEFGTWRERWLDLGIIRIYEHKANLKRKVNVQFDSNTLGNYVHHCISLDGEMGAHFSNVNLSAVLNPKTYHQVFLQDNSYFLSMGTTFTNVHIEVKCEHYLDLLCESEKWSSDLKEKISKKKTHYSGEFPLSPNMVRTVYSIFDSPLSGSLKKLLIEASVHELLALQLHHTIHRYSDQSSQKGKDVFHSIRQYLDETFLQEHSLKTIARHFGINEFSLKKGFREHYNTTVFEYLLNKRLEHGRELLFSTDKTIQQVSTIVGYKYPNHFSVAFKKRFGVSPVKLK